MYTAMIIECLGWKTNLLTVIACTLKMSEATCCFSNFTEERQLTQVFGLSLFTILFTDDTFAAQGKPQGISRQGISSQCWGQQTKHAMQLYQSVPCL